MTNTKNLLLGTLLAIAITPAAFAQSSTTAVPLDCNADFAAQDGDANGYLSETESPRPYARSRVDGTTMAETGMSMEEYAALCNGPNWAENTPEEGAPFEGSNSFTEAQARDRALAWNVTDISALTLDDQGIWRGQGMVAGAASSVAVDYKGNVVTTAAQP